MKKLTALLLALAMILALAVPAMACSVLGGLLGSHLAIRKGACFIRAVMMGVTVLLLIRLATLAVPAVALGLGLLIPGIQMHIIMIVSLLYFIFLVAFHKLITVSYANWLCETYLNPRIEGARTNIGLRPENWDDVTYIPEDDED